MNKTVVLSALGIAFTCAGCLVAPFQPPTSGIVSSYKAPLSTEGMLKGGSKTGTADTINVLGFVTVGDCSIATAMNNGGLKSANYIDYEYFNILGFFQKVTVIVTGD